MNEQDWTTKIIEAIYAVKEQLREPKKIIIPLAIQKEMALASLPSLGHEGEEKQKLVEMIEANGLISFYGYPVEDGDAISVEF
jgi:hypothetical protein